MSKAQGYQGNKNLVGEGDKFAFSQYEINEFYKCASDVNYFIENYIKITHMDHGIIPFKPYKYQKKIVDTVSNNKLTIVKLPRQSGKSTIVGAVLLWYALFNEATPVAVVAHKMDMAQKIIASIQLSYEKLPAFLKIPVTTWNKRRLEFSNLSSIIAGATTDGALRGEAVKILYLDEFAFVPRNIQEDFMNSVYPTITSGKSSKIIITSTPKGFDMFYTIWDGATKGKNGYVPIEINWWDTPGRDQKWKEEVIAATSEKQFAQEFETKFLGSTDTLIDANILATLDSTDPILKSDQGLRVYENPEADHVYFMTVDTARGVMGDYSVFSIFDCTSIPYKQVAVFRNNLINPINFAHHCYAAARMYNDSYVLVESNDIGGEVADVMFYDLEYDNVMKTTANGRKGQVMGSGFGQAKSALGVKMTNPVKVIGCSVLKTLIENGKLVIPDQSTILELYTFIQSGKSYEAEQGAHDDCVMTLVLFGWCTVQELFKAFTDTDLHAKMIAEYEKRMEEDMMPVGFKIDNSDEFEQMDTGFGWGRM